MMSCIDEVSCNSFYRRSILSLYGFLVLLDCGIIIRLFGNQFLSCEYFIITMERMYQFIVILLVSLYDRLLSEDCSVSYRLENSGVQKEKKLA